jgi:hypothetical protein
VSPGQDRGVVVDPVEPVLPDDASVLPEPVLELETTEPVLELETTEPAEVSDPDALEPGPLEPVVDSDPEPVVSLVADCPGIPEMSAM